MNTNINPIQSSFLLSKIYSSYESSLKNSYHLPYHLKDTLTLYRDVYGETINDEYKRLIFHFHVIINSVDDIIDNTPMEIRKKNSIASIMIFNSFFMLFETILNLFGQSEQIVIPENIKSSFFNQLYQNIIEISEGPLQELNPPEGNRNNVEDTIIDVLTNRCRAHIFVSNLCDSLLKIQNSNIILRDLTSPLLTYKILEMLVRDLEPGELVKDKKFQTFNIILYIQTKLQVSEVDEIKQVLTKTVDVLVERFDQEIKLLLTSVKPDRKISLETSFKKKIIEFNENLNKFTLIKSN